MKKFFKWAGIVLASLVLILVGAGAFIYFSVESRFNKEYQVKVEPLAIPTDSATIALGAHVAAIKGCTDCHGKDLSGNIVINDKGLGLVPAPNLTLGKGGLSSRHGSFTDEDFIRAIRHGVGKNGKTLKLMPSYEYNSLSKEDLSAVISYVKSRPSVDKAMPAIKLKPVAYVLTQLNKLPFVVAEKIDHNKPITEGIHPEVTATYGQYLAVVCSGCHGENYLGGEAIIPGSPNVPNITGSGSLSKWSEPQFIQTLRTGVTPEGKKLNPKYMPWPMAKEFTETEIKSLYLFLKQKQTS